MAFLDEVPFLKRMLEMAYTIALVILISGIVGLVLAFPVKLLWNFVFGDVYDLIMTGRTEGHLPGFGHPTYKKEDPRVQIIENYWLGELPLFYQHMKDLSEDTGLSLNMAGALTPFLMEIGFKRHNIDSFPLMCRMIGLTKIYNNIKTNGGIKLGPGIGSIRKAQDICSKS